MQIVGLVHDSYATVCILYAFECIIKWTKDFFLNVVSQNEV